MTAQPLRTAPPPRRVLTLAMYIVEATTGDAEGWRTVADADILDATGYKLSTLQLAWQELADMGAAQVGRSDGHGRRSFRLNPHPVWAAALALTDREARS